MDQDVEAILNASDSEEDDSLNVQGVSLEDILREDDGGDDSGDGNPFYYGTSGGAIGAEPRHLDRYIAAVLTTLLAVGKRM